MAITKPPVLPAWAESGDKVTPSNAEIKVGWPLSSIPPSRQRFNWLLNFLANGIRYFSRRGLPDYDAAETYMIGDRIIGDDGKTYRSLIDNNTAQTPSTSPTKWERWALTLAEMYTSLTSPAQFDNSVKPATTAFVQRALGNSSGAVSFDLGGSVSLVAADSGKTVNISGSVATTITLPEGATLPYGATFEFFQSNIQATTIQRYGADAVYVNSGTVTSFTLYAGDSLKLVWIGAWVAVSGTAQAQYSTGRFGTTLADSGYQKLPSGLIIQWGGTGSVTTTTTPTNLLVTLPIAFPNNISTVVVTRAADVASSASPFTTECVSATSLTQFTITHARSAGSITNSWRWIAIGY